MNPRIQALVLAVHRRFADTASTTRPVTYQEIIDRVGDICVENGYARDLCWQVLYRLILEKRIDRIKPDGWVFTSPSGSTSTPPAETASVDSKTEVAPVGVKDDSGKLEYTQLPYDAVKEVIRVLSWGAYDRPRANGKRGYGPRNWEHVQEARSRYYNSAMRHLNTWFHGEARNDDGPEGSGMHHLAHAISCLLFLLSMDLRRMLDGDPYKEGN